MGLRAVANPLASGALPSNVTSASLNSITPAGGALGITGAISATGNITGAGVRADQVLNATGVTGNIWTPTTWDMYVNGVIRGNLSAAGFVVTGAINATGTITSSNAIETLNSGSLFQYNAGSTTYFGTRNNANNLDVSYNGGGVITRTNTSGFAVTGSISATTEIRPKATPNLDWGINFAESTAVPNCITLPNGDTYDLAAGSGLVVLHSNTTGSIGVFAAAGGVTTVISDPSAQYSVASGTATKINVYYNGTDKYRIQNLTGGSVTLFIAGIKTRTAT